MLGYFVFSFSVSLFISVVYLVGVAHFGWFGLLVLVFVYALVPEGVWGTQALAWGKGRKWNGSPFYIATWWFPR